MYNTVMSEQVPIQMTTRGEYDVLSKDRVKMQKLTRGVIYVLMLKVESDNYRAGRLTVELPRVPAFGTNDSGDALSVDVTFMDDDAQPVFQLAGIMKMDQLYLQPVRLQIVNTGSTLREGYFLSNAEEAQMAMQFQELVGSTHSPNLSL
jgi:hypothetical protein